MIQEQINALVRQEVYRTLVDMGVMKEHISAREAWKMCGRRRFEALVKEGCVSPKIIKGFKLPKFSRSEILQALANKNKLQIL